jgi:mRNA interferase RelE/StbE
MKTYKVILSTRAKRDFKKLDAKIKKRILPALIALGQDPFLGKKLKKKFKGCFSIRAWPYRIVYYVEREKILVVVIRIRHRKDSYR